MIRLSPIGSYCYWLFDESKVKARLNRMQLSALVRISILNHTNFKAKKEVNTKSTSCVNASLSFYC